MPTTPTPLEDLTRLRATAARCRAVQRALRSCRDPEVPRLLAEAAATLDALADRITRIECELID